MKKTKSGFTIVELLIVIVVIGILASITVVAYTGVQNRATAAAVTSGLKSIEEALQIESIDKGWTEWPNDEQILGAGGNPTVEDLIANLDGFNQYLQQVPSAPGVLSSDWVYDSDQDLKIECDNITNGTNIIIRDIPQSVASIVDDQLDGDGRLDCSTVRWRSYNSSLYYALSYTDAFTQ